MKESVKAIKAGGYTLSDGLMAAKLALWVQSLTVSHFTLSVFNLSLFQERIFHLYLSAELKGSAQLFDREALAWHSAESAVAHSCAGVGHRKHG